MHRRRVGPGFLLELNTITADKHWTEKFYAPSLRGFRVGFRFTIGRADWLQWLVQEAAISWSHRKRGTTASFLHCLCRKEAGHSHTARRPRSTMTLVRSQFRPTAHTVLSARKLTQHILPAITTETNFGYTAEDPKTEPPNIHRTRPIYSWM